MAKTPTQTASIALKAPTRIDWTTKEGHHHVLVTTDGKRKFVSYSDSMVEAFTKANLAGVAHEYVYIEKPGKDPVIVEIPGVWKDEAKPRGSAKMFTDEQFAEVRRWVALLAASRLTSDSQSVLENAEHFAAWFTERPRRSRQAAQERRNGDVPPQPPVAAEPEAETPWPVMPPAGREQLTKAVMARLLDRFADRDQAKAWLHDKFGPDYTGLASLSEDDLRRLHDELVAGDLL